MREPTRAMFLVAIATAASGCSSSAPCADPSDAADAAPELDAPESGAFDVPTGPVTTIPLTGCGGPGYAANVTIGSQTFQLTIDTGSSSIAVASSACQNCGVSPVYMPGSSAVDNMATASDSYLKGSWQGESYTDSVQLAGTGQVTMKLAAIDSQTDFFDNSGCALGTVPFAPQGIIGFGPPDLAVTGTDAFVSKLSRAGAAKNVFAFEFCALGGQLMIGDVDPTAAALTGPAVYTPMTSSQYFGVTLNDLRLAGASLGFGSADFGTTAVDTGTSVLALPAAVFTALTSQIENTPAFRTAFGDETSWMGTTTCISSPSTSADLDAHLPPLTLVFPAPDGGTSEVTLKATQSYLPVTISNGTAYYCSGVISNPNPNSGTIIGTSVMLGQLAIFDLDTNEFGFAPQTFCQ